MRHRISLKSRQLETEGQTRVTENLNKKENKTEIKILTNLGLT